MSYGPLVESTPDRPGWPVAPETAARLGALMAEHDVYARLDELSRTPSAYLEGVSVVGYRTYPGPVSHWNGMFFRRQPASGVVEVTHETSGRTQSQAAPDLARYYGSLAKFVIHPDGDTRIVRLSVEKDQRPQYFEALRAAQRRLAVLDVQQSGGPAIEPTEHAVATAQAFDHLALRAQALKMLGIEQPSPDVSPRPMGPYREPLVSPGEL